MAGSWEMCPTRTARLVHVGFIAHNNVNPELLSFMKKEKFELVMRPRHKNSDALLPRDTSVVMVAHPPSNFSLFFIQVIFIIKNNFIWLFDCNNI